VRPFLTFVILLVVVGLIGGVKACQIATLVKVGKAAQAAGPVPEAVSTVAAKSEAWEVTLPAIGTVTAVRGVIVSNETAGVVTKIQFDSGGVVRGGQVLVELDTSVERAQLASAEARRELARVNARRSEVLAEKQTISRSQLDEDVTSLHATRADRGAIAAQIGRRVVRAPFDGRLGLRNVNLGQYLAPGTAITVLESIGAVYVDFTLPEQLLGGLQVGMAVRARSEPAGEAAIDGQLAAIEPASDPSTHTVKLRATIPNEDDRLRSGMYADVSVVLPQKSVHVVVPLTAIVHAPYGDSVFVVEPEKDAAGKPVTGVDGRPVLVARQRFVRRGDARGDFGAILEGVRAGEEVVAAGAFKLRNGARVAVKNDVPLQPKLEPHPENR